MFERVRRGVRSRLGILRRVERDGIRFFGDRSHQQHLLAIATGRDEPETLERFTAALRPGDVVYDVGAYLGSYCLRAARTVGATGRVVAFEPDPATRSALERAAKANGFEDRITIVGAAAGATPGSTLLHRHPTDPSQTSTVDGRPGETVVVEVRRLDDPELPAPDAVKIDAEGLDLEVLRSLGDRLAAVRVLVVECAGGDERRAAELAEVLLDHGFADLLVINERGGGVHEWPLDDADLTASYVNLFATR